MSDNQHYITKAYLDRFVHSTSGQRVLYPYSRAQGIRKAKGTKRLGCADSFFLQKDGSEVNNKVDEARKTIESQVFASGKATAGPLAKCIFDDSYLPNTQEIGELILAAAFLWWSSPVQIQNSAMITLLSYQADLFNRMNTEKAKAYYQEQYGDQATAQLKADREAVLNGELFVDVGEENWRQLGFSSPSDMAIVGEQLARMEFALCHSHRNSFFLTSDNPVLFLSSAQPNNPGLELPDTRVWFPISHNRGLLWSHRKKNPLGSIRLERRNLGFSETRTLNRHIVKWSYKDVYSPLPESWVEEAVKSAEFDPCFGHYGSLKQLIEAHTAPAVFHGPNGKQRNGEIVNMTAGLRTGEKCDAVRIGRPG